MPNLLASLGQQYEIIAGTGIAENLRLTFDGGGSSGATGTLTLFTVSGTVGIKIIAIGEVTPVSAGGGTLAIGTTSLTTGIATTTTATAIAAGLGWWNASPAAAAATSNFTERVTNENILLTIGTATITAGRIRFVALWKPLTPGATVTSTFPIGSASPSPSPSVSPSASLSPSSSASRSVSPSASLSPSASISPSASASRSVSPSASSSPSASQSPSASRSPSSSASPSASNSPSFAP